MCYTVPRTRADGGAPPTAEVDATQNSVLKSRFEITGYPTIKFLRKDTQPQDYHYPRTVEGFTAFTERMLGTSPVLAHRQPPFVCVTPVVRGHGLGDQPHRCSASALAAPSTSSSVTRSTPCRSSSPWYAVA